MTLSENDAKKTIELVKWGLEQRLNGMDKALRYHEKVLDHRLANLNELRAEVLKDREQFVKREAYDVQAESITTLLISLDKKVEKIETRFVTWIAAAVFFIAIMEVVVRYLK